MSTLRGNLRGRTLAAAAMLCWVLLVNTCANAALPFAGSSDVSTSIYFCKCICFSNYTILPLYRPVDPAKPCLSCTKQFCLDQKLPICKDANIGDADPDTATGQEGDVQTKCFQRDSALSYSVVMIFIILTSGLLIWAGIRDRFGDKLAHTRVFPSLETLRNRLTSNRPYTRFS